MKILITGATGNVGKGMTQILREKHEIVLHDIGPFKTDLKYYQGDLQAGQNLYPAMQGCDVVLHTPAWHGIHWASRTRLDFWRLNIDGTYHVFDTAAETGVKKVVFMSSTAWYGHYNKYGFTKRIGEEICEYFWQNHKIKYAAMRPAAFVPYRPGLEGAMDMIRRFMNNDPDRRDVLECIRLAIETDAFTNDWFHILSQHPFSDEDMNRFESSPDEVLEKYVPGAQALITKYGIKLEGKPRSADIEKTRSVLGWNPKYNLVTFFSELVELEKTGGIDRLACDYPLPLP